MNTAAKKFRQIILKIVRSLVGLSMLFTDSRSATQGFDVGFKEFRVQNMVAKANVKFPIRLERLAR